MTSLRKICRPLIEIVRYLRQAVYPILCCSCGSQRPMRGHVFCLDCIMELPLSQMHVAKENSLTRHFWCRTEVESGASMFMLDAKSRVKRIIHDIKYRNQPHLACILGKWYGRKLRDSQYFKDIDLIVPVPLHKSKLRKRGYNQCDFWAKGLGEGMSISCSTKLMKRIKRTVSQTKMDRKDRYLNMKGAFQVNIRKCKDVRHVLLADDVITTGATLESCIECLNELGIKVSIATMAIGQM